MNGALSSMRAQFVLSAQQSDAPNSWPQLSVGSWTLAAGPHLPVRELAFTIPNWRCWLLGWPIDPLNASGDPTDLQQAGGLSAFEAALNALSGRFIAVLLSPLADRLYLDASGTLAAVYCRARGIVASNPMLISRDNLTLDRTSLIRAMAVEKSNSYFAFATTPRHGIDRLLPNHYLDLSTFESVRHWLPPRIGGAVEEHVDGIIRRVRGATEAVARHETPYMTLTAGRDTRMLLAINRALRRQISFFTFDLPDRCAKADVVMAKKFARKFGLQYEVFGFEPARPEDVDEWLHRTGECVGEARGMSLMTVMKQMNPAKAVLAGNAAETGRSFFWRPGDEHGGSLSPLEAVQRLGNVTVHPELVQAAEHWLAELSELHLCTVLDLLYIEQRLGCWLGPALYPEYGPYILPFSNRQIFANMMSLPYEYRMQERVAEDIIRKTWAELLEWPFNPPRRRDRVIAEASSVLETASRALSKVPFAWRGSAALNAVARWLNSP